MPRVGEGREAVITTRRYVDIRLEEIRRRAPRFWMGRMVLRKKARR